MGVINSPFVEAAINHEQRQNGWKSIPFIGSELRWIPEHECGKRILRVACVKHVWPKHLANAISLSWSSGAAQQYDDDERGLGSTESAWSALPPSSLLNDYEST